MQKYLNLPKLANLLPKIVPYTMHFPSNFSFETQNWKTA